MSTTQAIIEWDSETRRILKLNGVPVTPRTGSAVLGARVNGDAFGVTPGQRVLPERPAGVPENAVLGFVYVTPEANTGSAEVYNLEGEVFDWRSDEAAIERYGVTFPDPEPTPTPESIITTAFASTAEAADLIAALDAAGFEIVRKADFRVAVAPEGM